MVKRPVICDLGVRVRCVFKDADDLVVCGHPSSWCQVKPVHSMVAQALMSLFRDG